MKYEVSAKNTKGALKTLNAGKNGIEVYFTAKRQSQDEHLDKKIFIRYSINNKGEQILEIFGSEPITLVAEKFNLVEI